MLHKSYKLILFIICIFIFTGCTAEYNINISKDKIIKEELNVIEKNSLKWNKKNNLLYNVTPREYLKMDLKWPTTSYFDGKINPIEPIKFDEQKYYSKVDISNLSQLGIKYKNKFGIYSYKNSNILNRCYDIDYVNDLNEISVKTKNSFKCFDKYKILDEVKVILNTDCEVVKENSDSKVGNKLIWKINKNNYKNKVINFKLNCKNEIKRQNKNNSFFRIIYFTLLYSLIILLIFLICNIISYNNNKI